MQVDLQHPPAPFSRLQIQSGEQHAAHQKARHEEERIDREEGSCDRLGREPGGITSVNNEIAWSARDGFLIYTLELEKMTKGMCSGLPPAGGIFL